MVLLKKVKCGQKLRFSEEFSKDLILTNRFTTGPRPRFFITNIQTLDENQNSFNSFSSFNIFLKVLLFVVSKR